jgi:hypothetical protein
MAFDHVQPGQPLRIPAPDYNAAMDAAAAHARRVQGGQPPVRARYRDAGTVTIYNATGSDLNRFGVICIDAMRIGPTDNLDQFQSRALFSASTPATGDDGLFAVAIEPIPAGEIGRAVVSGATPVKLYIDDTGHKFADIRNADATRLETRETGTARILWRASGTSGDEVWAEVLLGSTATVATGEVALARAKGLSTASAVVSSFTPPSHLSGLVGWKIVCNPIDAAGTVDTGTDIDLYISGIGGDACYPNIFGQDILPYQLDPGGGRICLQPNLDAPIGSARMHWTASGTYGIPRGWHEADGSTVNGIALPNWKDRYMLAAGDYYGEGVSSLGPTDNHHQHKVPFTPIGITSGSDDYAIQAPGGDLYTDETNLGGSLPDQKHPLVPTAAVAMIIRVE